MIQPRLATHIALLTLTLVVLFSGTLCAQPPTQVGFPVPIAPPTEIYVVDLDHDGFMEIVSPAPSSMGAAFLGLRDHTGAVIPEFDTNQAGGAYGWPVATAQLDADSPLELVDRTQFRSAIMAFDDDGTALLRTPFLDPDPFDNRLIEYFVPVDLDLDGVDEILTSHIPIFSNLAPDRLFALEADGTSVPGWDFVFEGLGGATSGVPSHIAVGDLEFDGELDIVVCLQRGNAFAQLLDQIAVFDRHGNFRPGYPMLPGFSGMRYATIVDLDNDRSCEIVGQRSGSLVILNADGSLRRDVDWTPPVYPDLPYAHSVGDLDGDGDKEIVVSCLNGIAAYDPQADTLLWSFAFPPVVGQNPAAFPGTAVIGDLDGDGTQEVVVRTRVPNSTFAFDHLGNALPGFPLPFIMVAFDSAALSRGVHLYDLDNDGDLELVQDRFIANNTPTIPGDDCEIIALDFPNSGTEPARADWPTEFGNDRRSGFFHEYDPKLFVRGDADRDGLVNFIDVIPMLLVVAGNEKTTCKAQIDWNFDGTLGLTDVIGLLQYVVAGGAPPPAGPFPDCGTFPDASPPQVTCGPIWCPGT